MAKLRLGFADLALTRPLTWALLKGEHSEVFETRVLPHHRVLPLLLEGALDVGLVAAEDFDEERLAALPDLGVVLRRGGGVVWVQGSEDASGTHPLSVRVDQSCPGTTACFLAWLERVRRSERGGEPVDNGARQVSAATVFSRAHSDLSSDLSDLFESQFGCEPVLYLWASRRDQNIREAEFALKSCLRFGLSALPALARELAAELSAMGLGERTPSLRSEDIVKVFEQGLAFVRPRSRRLGSQL